MTECVFDSACPAGLHATTRLLPSPGSWPFSCFQLSVHCTWLGCRLWQTDDTFSLSVWSFSCFYANSTTFNIRNLEFLFSFCFPSGLVCIGSEVLFSFLEVRLSRGLLQCFLSSPFFSPLLYHTVRKKRRKAGGTKKIEKHKEGRGAGNSTLRSNVNEHTCYTSNAFSLMSRSYPY